MNTSRASTSLNMETCAIRIGTRFDLVLVAAQRARELERGHRKLVNTNNSNVVTALQEIEDGLIGRDYLNKLR